MKVETEYGTVYIKLKPNSISMGSKTAACKEAEHVLVCMDKLYTVMKTTRKASDALAILRDLYPYEKSEAGKRGCGKVRSWWRRILNLVDNKPK